MDRFIFPRIAGQDSNGCARKEALQVFSHNSLRVIEESHDFARFPNRQTNPRLRNIREKGMPAWAFEIQTT